MPQAQNVLCLLRQMIMHVAQKEHTGIRVYVWFKIDLQTRGAFGFPCECESQIRPSLCFEIRC